MLPWIILIINLIAVNGQYNAGENDDSVVFEGLVRRFLVHVPQAFFNVEVEEVPYNMVILLHGGGGTGQHMYETYGFAPVAERENFIAVYPQGYGYSWNGGSCCGEAANSDINDVGFVADTIPSIVENELSRSNSTRPLNKIFYMGHSNGGFLAVRVGCERAEVMGSRFGAVAMYGSDLEYPQCDSNVPFRYYHFHGTDDAYVKWEGGKSCNSESVFIGVNATLEHIISQNECGRTTQFLYADEELSCFAYQQCEEDVVICPLEGVGHVFPPRQSDRQCDEDGAMSFLTTVPTHMYDFMKGEGVN